MKKSIVNVFRALIPLVAVSAIFITLTAYAEVMKHEPLNSTRNQLLDFDNILVNTVNNAGPQYDATVALNFRNPVNAVIVWQDMALEYPRVGYAYSFDGGQSWIDAIFNLPSYPSQSEPSIVADSNGNFFVCMAGGDTTGQTHGNIIVLKSTDGGITWLEPAVAVPGSSDYHDIMPKIAIDNTPFGSRGFIYVVWVRYYDDLSTSLVYCTQSGDTGHTFLPPIQVSDSHNVRWPNINIRSAFGNGDVDVCWLRSNPRGMAWDHSVTEGWSFYDDIWFIISVADNTEINGGISVSSIPVMAGNNQEGSYGFEHAYIVHMDSSNSRSDLDIYCQRITSSFDVMEIDDFSPFVRANDDDQDNGADQFMPAVAVDEQGRVHVAFCDRRLDANNLLYDVYYTSSSDLGDTWTPNARVSNVSSDPTQPGVAGQIGNRIGISAWGGHVLITWTDARNGNTDIYVSRLSETGISEEPAPLPANISLDNVYPNPFNNSVEIRFSSNSAQQVNVDVIDLLGRHVATLFNGDCKAGLNTLIWNGKNSNDQNASSGIYIVRLIGNSQALFKKAVMLK